MAAFEVILPCRLSGAVWGLLGSMRAVTTAIARRMASGSVLVL